MKLNESVIPTSGLEINRKSPSLGSRWGSKRRVSFFVLFEHTVLMHPHSTENGTDRRMSVCEAHTSLGRIINNIFQETKGCTSV